MKLIKEHIIFEKFTEDSDPIEDLGIGITHIIKDCVKLIFKLDNENEATEYLHISSQSDWNQPGNNRILYSIKINPKTLAFGIGCYRNKFRYVKNPGKLIDKVDYVTNILNKLNILFCFEEEIKTWQGKTPADHFECDLIKFKIKKKYSKFFKPVDKFYHSV